MSQCPPFQPAEVRLPLAGSVSSGKETRILFTMTVGFVVVTLWTVIAWTRYFLASADRSAGRRELAWTVSKLLGILAIVLAVLYVLYWVQRGK
jgi:heme/copper-type cytochrome/quinol oxidase subunit 2